MAISTKNHKNSSETLQPLEDAIKDVFIPALVGRKITQHERTIFALPTRFGGMGIANPCDEADSEYNNSFNVTSPLKHVIKQQSDNFDNVNTEEIKRQKQRVKTEKKERNEEKFQSIISSRDTTPSLARALELAIEKGSSSWLNTAPNRDLGLFLNKQEFRDSICLRYN